MYPAAALCPKLRELPFPSTEILGWQRSGATDQVTDLLFFHLWTEILLTSFNSFKFCPPLRHIFLETLLALCALRQLKFERLDRGLIFLNRQLPCRRILRTSN